MRTLFVYLLTACSACFSAEWKHGTVELHDGKKQEGAVLDEPGQPLRVKMGAVVAMFQRHEVKSVTIEDAPAGNPFVLMEKEYPEIAQDEGFRAVLRETLKEYPKLDARPAWELSMKVHALRIRNELLQKEVDALKPLAEKELARQAKADAEKAAAANPRLDPEGYIMRSPKLRLAYASLTDWQILQVRIIAGRVAKGQAYTLARLSEMPREQRLLIEIFFPYAVQKD